MPRGEVRPARGLRRAFDTTLGERAARLLAPAGYVWERPSPSQVALRARAETLPFAALAVVRNDPKARLDACAARLAVLPARLADELRACPVCRAYVVWGEVPRA